jgi:Tol biopolymer transport system component
MKYIISLCVGGFLLFFVSCGILDSGGGNPDYQQFSINRLYAINLDGTGIKLLTLGYHFSVLHNGRIAYLKDNKLYSCNSDGTDTLNLLPEYSSVYGYQLAFNGTKIIFEQYPNAYIMNSDGSGLSQLNLHGNLSITSNLVFSPDGQKIAYANAKGLYIEDRTSSDLYLIRDTTNNSYFTIFNFTPDGKNLIYIQILPNDYARDLRLYKINSKQDISLYYYGDYNSVINFSVSQGSKMVFSNTVGINLQDLNTFTYNLIYNGGDAHFSYDTTKITFQDFNKNAIGIMDLNTYAVNLFPINLPGNSISGPTLSADGKRIIFQADTSWSVLHK